MPLKTWDSAVKTGDTAVKTGESSKDSVITDSGHSSKHSVIKDRGHSSKDSVIKDRGLSSKLYCVMSLHTKILTDYLYCRGFVEADLNLNCVVFCS